MIKITKSKIDKKFGESIFESIAVGAAHELLRHDLVEHLAEIQKEMHFKYCRFHGLFNRKMAVAQRMQNGTLAYQWHHVDKITDNLLSVGLKAFGQDNCHAFTLGFFLLEFLIIIVSYAKELSFSL